MTISILGTDYTLEIRPYDSDPVFRRRNIQGYCDALTRQIVSCDMDTFPTWEDEDAATKRACEKATIRHEIVHAFLHESGLNNSSHESEAWATDEEVVEWVALQGPKIYKAWQEAEAL